MSKYDETMELIRQHTAPKYYAIQLTEGEVKALSIYLDAYLPENLREDSEWDNLEWLHNVMGAWKKIDDLSKQLIAEKNAAKKKDGVKPDYEREIKVDTYGGNAEVSFF